MVADSGTYDESTIMRRRKVAEAMLNDGVKPQKIEHWTQGLAQLARAGIGGYLTNQADEEKKAEDYKQTADLYRSAGLPPPAAPEATPSIFSRMASAMSGGGEPAPVTPAAPAAAPPMGALISQISAQPPAPPSGPGKIYTNDEPSPLDPPSGMDRKAMIATILGEAGNQGPQGMNAVGSVIRNRAVNGGFGGDTPTGVVTAKNQFEPWNTEAGRSKMSAAMADPKQAAAADQAIALAYGEGGQAPVDPTNGAMNFIAPKAQIALGRDMPKWAQGPGQDIGDHRFFGGKPQDPQAPYQVAGPPTAAPSGPPAIAQAMGAPPVQPSTQPSGIFAGVPQDKIPGILQGLTSKNPTMKALAVQQLGNYTKADAPTDETKEYKLAQSQGYKGSFMDFKTELKKAGATNVTTNVDKGENSFATEAGKVQAKRFNELAEEGQKARQMVADIDTLTELGKNIGTGKGAEITARIGPWAESIGVPIKGLSDIQAFEAIVNRVAPSMRVPGSGAQSDFELKNFLKSLPTLGNTPEGNAIAAATMKGLQENKIRAAEIGSKALNGEITRPQAEKMLRELPDPMDGYRAYTKNKPAVAKPAEAPKAGGVTEGATATNPKTGERMIFEGGQWKPLA